MRKKPKPKQIQPGDTLAGNNPRHEVAGCPTGLDSEQAQAPQREGGGGAPGTGDPGEPTPPDDAMEEKDRSSFPTRQ